MHTLVEFAIYRKEDYIIMILYRAGQRVQLVCRRWEITDAQGYTEVVEGPGVIGISEKPNRIISMTPYYTK